MDDCFRIYSWRKIKDVVPELSFPFLIKALDFFYMSAKLEKSGVNKMFEYFIQDRIFARTVTRGTCGAHGNEHSYITTRQLQCILYIICTLM